MRHSSSSSKNLENSLSSEPSEFDENVYNIVFRYNDLTFKRRFLESDEINVKFFFPIKQKLVIFAKLKIKTLKEIELFEPFPRKVYNNESQIIKDSGISKNQILMVKLI